MPNAEVASASQRVLGRALVRFDTRTKDSFKLIVGKRPINHHLFYQLIFGQRLRGEENHMALNPLERLLVDALTGTRTADAIETGSWYAENLIVDMR